MRRFLLWFAREKHVCPADLLANSLEYPERIQRGNEWTQLLKRLLVCLSVGKFSHFPSFNLLFLYSTVQKSVVQYRYLFGASIL